MGRDGVAFSFVVPEQGKLLDEIEKAISRELESDQVEGIPAPARPVFRPQRPATRRKGSAPASARGYRPARRGNVGFHTDGIRRRRSPQGVGG
jgi:ATP-dependent RNA helicase DeaD